MILQMKQKFFKHQITLNAVLKKYKSTETEFSSVYFNSTTKTMINHKFDLDKSFQDNQNRINNGINEGSVWLVESIVSQ